MKRRPFTVLAALSLLLFVAMLALWVRSHWVSDVIAYGWVSNDGMVRTYLQADSSESQLSFWHWVTDYSVTERARNVATREVVKTGFHYGRSDPPGEGMRGWGYGARYRQKMTVFATASRIGVGHWVLVLVFWLLPAIWIRDFARRRSRTRAGLCAACGYDVRATPGRCSECGASA